MLNKVFFERLWRLMKEEVYQNSYEVIPEGVSSLGHYFGFSHEERLR